MNDVLCRNDPKNYSPGIGAFTGIIQELISTNIQNPQYKPGIISHNKMYMPGRLSEEMLQTL